MSIEAPIFAPDLVQAVARGLFPDDVALALSFPWEVAEGLLPDERASLRAPNDKRLREFAAGRRAARQAMLQLGLPASAVPHGPDRAPQWPAAVGGSITHSDSICLAALGHASHYAALAIDVEEDTDLPEDILTEVCSAMELAWLSVQPEGARGQLARLIFSAKECAYKLQYPLTGQLLGFEAFEITPDLETGQFEATLTQDVAPFAARHHFVGRFAFGAGLVLTGMALPHTALP